MTDRPIIFSASMVRALLREAAEPGTGKSQTRRLAGGWRKVRDPVEKGKWLEGWRPTSWTKVDSGDRLWVRENLAVMGNWGVWHDASEPPSQGKFLDDLDARGLVLLERYAPTEATDSARIPSIHMPRWASRLTLIVTAIKIERLQEITHEEAEAEGVKCDMSARGFRDHFAELWKRLHGPDSWNENPEVVALTFTVHDRNIDRMECAA